MNKESLKRFGLNFSIFRDLMIFLFKRKWRKQNRENFTYPVNVFDMKKVTVGKYTYGPLYVKEYENKNEKLKIGNFCSIAENVKFLLSGEHEYRNFSTYPFKNLVIGKESESICKGEIVLEDDVWIGYGSIILSGVKIARGAVIGANSIVTKDVPAYSIWCGNKVIKKRFEDEICEQLMQIDFKNFDKQFVEKKLEYLYTTISKENIKEIVKNLK